MSQTTENQQELAGSVLPVWPDEQAVPDELEALIARRAAQERARVQLLMSPAFFLDEAALPDWLYVSHAGAELYAQAFAAEQALGPRRFLGFLPAGSILPQMPRHPHWRMCVVPVAADCVVEYLWPQADQLDASGLPEAEDAARNLVQGREAIILALEPLLQAMQNIPHMATSLCMVDLLTSRTPRATLQQWLLACLSSVQERRRPLPLEGMSMANLQARHAALAKLAKVMHPRQQGLAGQADSLAARAAGVARAQGLLLPKEASQAQAGESLQAWAARAGLRLRRVALRSAWWQQAGLPLLGFLADEAQAGMSQEALEQQAELTAVQLLPVAHGSDTQYSWRATSTGPAAPLGPQVAERLAPFAYSLHGTLPARRLSLPDWLKLGWRAAHADVPLLAGMALAAGAVGALAPMAVAYVLQSVVPTGEHGLLLVFSVLLLVLSLVAGLLHLCADLAALRIEGRLGNAVQGALFDRLLRLPLPFFASISSGDLANRMATVDVVRRSVAHLLVSAGSGLCYAFGAWAMLCYLMPSVASLAALVMLLIWGCAALSGWKQVQSLHQGEQIEGNVMALVVQLLQGISKLRLAGAEDRGFALWARGFAELRTRISLGRRWQVHYAALVALAEVALLLGVCMLVAYAGPKQPSTGEFLALLTALASFTASGVLVGQTICRLILLQPFYARLRPILEAQPEPLEQARQAPALHGSLEVVGLSFAYQQGGPQVLRDVSLQVRAGQFVAIVGSSGSGKSTLLRLLLGLEQPDSGSIYYDGRDLQSLSGQSVRRQIGVVLQNGRTMPGTLFENIAIAHDCSLEQAWAAARLAGLEDDIRAMPMGMHTVLSEGSAALSGGQVQRLLLARALAGQPRILFLDEATSALDNRTQAWITSSLHAMAMTRVVIAHRLSSVQQADLILVLREGRIVESGKYADLLAQNGHFAELAKRQLL